MSMKSKKVSKKKRVFKSAKKKDKARARIVLNDVVLDEPRDALYRATRDELRSMQTSAEGRARSDGEISGRIVGGKAICDAVLNYAKRLTKSGKTKDAATVFKLYEILLMFPV